MSAVELTGFAILAVVLLAVLRPMRPELAVLLTLGAGAVILLSLLPLIQRIIELLTTLAQRGNVPSLYLETILRIVGIAYIVEFGSQVARDAGEGALAAKVELGGKILILSLALPILLSVVQLVVRLLG